MAANHGASSTEKRLSHKNCARNISIASSSEAVCNLVFFTYFLGVYIFFQLFLNWICISLIEVHQEIYFS